MALLLNIFTPLQYLAVPVDDYDTKDRLTQTETIFKWVVGVLLFRFGRLLLQLLLSYGSYLDWLPAFRFGFLFLGGYRK